MATPTREEIDRLMPSVPFDPVADALDDMAALGLQWTRSRERGRMSGAIRLAMLMVAREVLAQVDAPAAAEPAKTRRTR